MPNNIEENSIMIEDNEIIREIFGDFDENINIMKEELGINIAIRDGEIKLYGDRVSIDLGQKLIYNLIEIVRK